jgi:lysophospholipase L1-like esterase
LRFFRLALSSYVLLAAFAVAGAQENDSRSQDHWVGTWAAAPFATVNDGTVLAQDTTFRQTVHVSLGGSTARVVFSNEFSARHEALTISGANIAPTSGDGTINPALARAITFDGRPETTIPAGTLVISDPIAIKVSALSDLVITMFVPKQPITSLTMHHTSVQTNYDATGNQLNAKTLSGARTSKHWYFLKGIDVLAGPDASSVVTLGDSITDGAGSTVDANNRWPDFLARRLQSDKKTADIGVLNEGIGGNRLLHEGTGPSALARFDRDVLSQTGVRYLIVYESINDVGGLANQKEPDNQITSAQLISALNQIIVRAHTHGIKVFGGTVTPFQGANYYTEEGEKVRQATNHFIRNSGKFDGVIDFDKMLREPDNPGHIVDAYSGNDAHRDHQHPNDTGYKVMGQGIDLKLFEK